MGADCYRLRHRHDADVHRNGGQDGLNFIRHAIIISVGQLVAVCDGCPLTDGRTALDGDNRPVRIRSQHGPRLPPQPRQDQSYLPVLSASELRPVEVEVARVAPSVLFSEAVENALDAR